MRKIVALAVLVTLSGFTWGCDTDPNSRARRHEAATMAAAKSTTSAIVCGTVTKVRVTFDPFTRKVDGMKFNEVIFPDGKVLEFLRRPELPDLTAGNNYQFKVTPASSGPKYEFIEGSEGGCGQK